MAIVLCRSDVFLRKQKTRVHILTRMSKYEQGGSWNNNAKNCVVGKRNNNPDNSNDNLGLRVAMSKNWRPCQFLDASFGRLRLPKRRYCVEPPPSVAVLRAHTNSVNCPYRVQETCGMDSGYPCSCAVMIRAVQIKGRNCRQNCEWRTVSGFFTQAERDMSCAKEEETS